MNKFPPSSTLAEAKKLTRDAGLRYTLGDEPGIKRERKRGGLFVYVRANGRPVKDARVLERIRKLVIPPAWENVWICEIANVEFAFRGKSGKQHQISLHDRALARIVRRCQDMPGQKLFTYLDADGKIHTISSHDVNTYLQEISGDDFTAKDFRTWEATVLAARALKAFDAPPAGSDSAKNVVTAVKAVAELLGNTPAVCRKSYIHPFIIESFENGVTISNSTQDASKVSKGLPAQLRADEKAVLSLLRKQLRKVH